jgi:hypothetical protein
MGGSTLLGICVAWSALWVCDDGAEHAASAVRPATQPPLIEPALGVAAVDTSDPSPARWVCGKLRVDAWYAGLSGHLQTPAGGRAGSTSSHRPGVGEIGLDGLEWLPSIDTRIGLPAYPASELHFQWISLNRDGSDVLRSDLISQNRFFPAGAAVEGSLDMDLFKIGYRLHGFGIEWGHVSVVPEIGLSANSFHYTLESAQVAGAVDRSYNIAFPYLGLLIHGRLSERLGWEVDLAGSSWFSGASFASSEVRLEYDLLDTDSCDVALSVGIRGHWLRRHDHQEPEQNDPNLRLGAFSDDPWGGLTVGLTVSF